MTRQRPWWRARSARLVAPSDVVVAAAAGLLMAVELADLHARLEPGVPLFVPGGIVAVMVATVAARRAAPLPAFAVNGVALLGYVALGYPGQVYPWTNALVLYAVAAHGRRVEALSGLALAVLGAAAYFRLAPVPGRGIDVAFILGAWIVVWVAGQLAAARRARQEEDDRARRREAEGVVAAERAGIAREVHDIVGHSLNVMVMHASGALRLVDREPGVAVSALETVRATGRQALAELDRLLGLLGDTDEPAARHPAAGVAALPALCDRVAGPDLEVTLDVAGRAGDVPAAVDLTVYRVAQEALTNVVKHAGASRAEVRVRFADGRIELDVLDDGRGPADDGGRGRGLGGLAERVEALRGTLDTGRSPLGGYLVRMVLPTGTES